MRIPLFLLTAIVLLLTACTQPSTSSSDDTSFSITNDRRQVMDDHAMMGGASDRMETEGKDIVFNTRIIDVTITNWSFTPAVVSVVKGEKVQLLLKGDGGIHSLAVDGLGLNVRVLPGETTLVDVPTDTVGTFKGRCGVPCGPGHRDMTFTIVIQ
jgi:cytochrome c oxidase subunit II